jgi:hypothetical protein
MNEMCNEAQFSRVGANWEKRGWQPAFWRETESRVETLVVPNADFKRAAFHLSAKQRQPTHQACCGTTPVDSRRIICGVTTRRRVLAGTFPAIRSISV